MKFAGLGLLIIGLIMLLVGAMGYHSWEWSVAGIAILLLGGFVFITPYISRRSSRPPWW
jgi:membrane protein implicated in regulation of membrane protease activity